MKKKHLFSLMFIFCLLVQFVRAQQPHYKMDNQKFNPYKYETNKNVACKNGAVVSAHALASMVGVNILKQGGNAVDAAIATQLAWRCIPGAGNIGGGGFTVVHLSSGENISLTIEVAPAAASRDIPTLTAIRNAFIAGRPSCSWRSLNHCRTICK
jgi:gamma-glutamyltranspeptidase/glutathione hydrolase